MLIKALCDYYEILDKRGALIPDGRSRVKVSYAVDLSESGDVVRVRSVKEKVVQPTKNGGEKVSYRPRSTVFPKRVETSTVYSNIVDHRPLYLFGLDIVDGDYAVTPKAKKSHEHFVSVNSEFFETLTEPLAKAFFGFIGKWNPSSERARELLEDIKQDYSGAFFAFCLDGYPNLYLNECEEVLKKFDVISSQEENAAAAMQCSVLGSREPIARLHNVIKGVAGGNPTGCRLVCVNNQSEESYGDSQGAVSKISETAMERYTAALNYLTDGANRHNVRIDDTTVLFWADAVDEDCYSILNSLMLGNDYSVGASETDLMLESALTQVKHGQKPDFSVFGADINTDYYIVGIVPNAARLSVKFVYRNTFGRIMENVLRYHGDFVHGEGDDGLTKAPSFRDMRGELLPKESKSAKLAPDFIDKMFLSMINGAPYPRTLLENAVRRSKTEAKINKVKVGLIKAYLNRKNKTEVISMSLNKQNTSPAYLSGRLFAVLEALQQKAAGGKLNSTIKDSFFSSACSTPSVVFPRLMQLAQNHLKKCDDGYAVYCNRIIGEIVDGLVDSFPKTLSLEQQGEFIVGYYQQQKEIYAKKEKE